jgi:hypothetical protein
MAYTSDMQIVRTLLLAGIALALPRAAGADVTVASKAGGTLYLHRVSAAQGATKIDKLLEDRGKGAPVAYAFTDARTLWVLRKAGAGHTIGKIVDGKAEAARPVKLTMATEGNEVPTGFDLTPGLVTTKGGQVLVTTCLDVEQPAVDNKFQCTIGYHRVDDGSDAFTKTRPKDVVFAFGVTKPPRMAALKKPPKGYNVKIVRTKLKRTGDTYTGFECTGPAGQKLTWPTEADQVIESVMTPAVTKATWLSESPAVVHIEATGVSPVKEKLYQEFFIADCSTKLSSVRALREGLWLTDDQLRKPTGEVIGTLPGESFVLAP